MNKKIRVLVIDDSALMRKLIPKILERDPAIEVVGTAIDGNFGLKKIEDLAPDVVTLDLEMPGLNGIDTLKQIMRRWHLPVIVVSSHSTAGAGITLKALTTGAFDFVAKPADVSNRMPEIADEPNRAFVQPVAGSESTHVLVAPERALRALRAAADPGRPAEERLTYLRCLPTKAGVKVVTVGIGDGGDREPARWEEIAPWLARQQPKIGPAPQKSQPAVESVAPRSAVEPELNL